MITFTRFSFLMRRVFFRLMHQDLNTILDGLRELEARGVEHAGLPLGAVLRRRTGVAAAHDLPVLEGDVPRRVLLRQPLRMLVDLRNVVDAALARAPRKSVSQPEETPPARALAAAAGAEFAVSTSEVPEFEVNSAPPEWDTNPESSETGSEGSENN